MTFVMIIIGILIGVLLTMFYTRFIGAEKPVGTLRIDTSDLDDGPYLFAELSVDPIIIMQRKQVLLNVDAKNFISHE